MGVWGFVAPLSTAICSHSVHTSETVSTARVNVDRNTPQTSAEAPPPEWLTAVNRAVCLAHHFHCVACPKVRPHRVQPSPGQEPAVQSSTPVAHPN